MIKMKEKLINNLKRFKYDWLSLIFFVLLILTQNIIFIIPFLTFILISEFKA
jgi:hypothetical protein